MRFNVCSRVELEPLSVKSEDGHDDTIVGYNSLGAILASQRVKMRRV